MALERRRSTAGVRGHPAFPSKPPPSPPGTGRRELPREPQAYQTEAGHGLRAAGAAADRGDAMEVRGRCRGEASPGVHGTPPPKSCVHSHIAHAWGRPRGPSERRRPQGGESRAEAVAGDRGPGIGVPATQSARRTSSVFQEEPTRAVGAQRAKPAS